MGFNSIHGNKYIPEYKPASHIQKDVKPLTIFEITDCEVELAKMAVGSVVYVAILVSAAAAYIFMQMETARQWKESGDIIYAAYVIHPAYAIMENLHSLVLPDLPRLVICRNIARVDVLETRKDRDKAVELIKKSVAEKSKAIQNLPESEREKAVQLLNDSSIDIEDFKKNYSVDTTGICAGLSLALIKTCFENNVPGAPINSHKVIQSARKFEKGGSAESAAYQQLYQNSVDSLNKLTEEAMAERKTKLIAKKNKINAKLIELKNIRDELRKKEDVLAEKEDALETLEDSTDKSSLELKLKNEKDVLEASFRDLRHQESQVVKEKKQYQKEFDVFNADIEKMNTIENKNEFALNAVAENIGLKTSDMSEDLDLNKLLKQPFGVYQMRIPTHSMVFIKTIEGYFVFDPNFGLIACDKKDPLKTIKTIVALTDQNPLTMVLSLLLNAVGLFESTCTLVKYEPITPKSKEKIEEKSNPISA